MIRREFIELTDWPEVKSLTTVGNGRFDMKIVPQFTPRNFIYLVERVNELAADVANLREQLLPTVK